MARKKYVVADGWVGLTACYPGGAVLLSPAASQRELRLLYAMGYEGVKVEEKEEEEKEE